MLILFANGPGAAELSTRNSKASPSGPEKMVRHRNTHTQLDLPTALSMWTEVPFLLKIKKKLKLESIAQQGETA